VRNSTQARLESVRSHFAAHERIQEIEKMTTTVTGLFDTRDAAAFAVVELKAAGIPNEEISIVTNKVDGQSTERSADDRTVDNNMAETGAADGAVIGGVLGGGAGLLAGLGLLTIPGIGPVLAAGWLLTTAVGTAVGASGGGLVGALVGAGVDNDDAQIYVERIRKGGTLVSARVSDKNVAAVEDDRPALVVADLPGDRAVETRTTTRVTTERPILRTGQ
jgi:hypothetical protein